MEHAINIFKKIHTYTHTHKHKYTHIHTNIHTHIHTNINIYIHTHIIPRWRKTSARG